MKKLKYIDLFCGTGAFSYILDKNDCECVFANDFDNNSEIIYKNNFNNHNFINKDLNEIDVKDIPKHDLLCGGFPCQPFSIAGEKKGFDDSRSNVFFKILEILEFHKPNFIILENVKNLLTHDKKNTFKIIKERLEKLNYNLNYSILDTCKITGIPQHRERIYIVGIKNVLNKTFNFDFPSIKLKNISTYLEQNIDDKYYYTDKYNCYTLLLNSINKTIDTNTVYQFRRSFVRENKNNVCPTLTANMGTGGHNVPLIKDKNGIRKLTPRECFNLQGFSNDYNFKNLSDSSLYKLAGNAVSIPIVNLIVTKLLQNL
jgi:DNA (cytosine-5)-methyltransferase 1